jgi:ATP-binding cassette, subfamily B (MDR/TAP), member 1
MSLFLHSVLFCMIMGNSAIGLIAPSIPTFLQAAASAQQVLKLLDESAVNGDIVGNGPNLKPLGIKGQLELKNVVFSYPERPTVTILNELSLEIAADKVTAVVGYSGSGKSTIIGLIERWYNPNSGSITLDGEDIKQYDLDWLKGQIGLVQQV